eukprot:COSAG01_NODE_7067_length_3368_cov_12.018748_1_plen_101_part_00
MGHRLGTTLGDIAACVETTAGTIELAHAHGEGGATFTPRPGASAGYMVGVRRPLPPCQRAVVTEIYLCGIRSCQKILRRLAGGPFRLRFTYMASVLVKTY